MIADERLLRGNNHILMPGAGESDRSGARCNAEGRENHDCEGDTASVEKHWSKGTFDGPILRRH